MYSMISFRGRDSSTTTNEIKGGPKKPKKTVCIGIDADAEDSEDEWCSIR